eukprot:1046454-Pleurochrysis_carterae.AAC.2
MPAWPALKVLPVWPAAPAHLANAHEAKRRADRTVEFVSGEWGCVGSQVDPRSLGAVLVAPERVRKRLLPVALRAALRVLPMRQRRRVDQAERRARVRGHAVGGSTRRTRLRRSLA